MPENFTIGECDACRRPVIAAVTLAVKHILVDAEPSATGTLRLLAQDKTLPVAVDLKPAERFGKTNLHTNHAATCPDVKRWQRPKRGRA